MIDWHHQGALLMSFVCRFRDLPHREVSVGCTTVGRTHQHAAGVGREREAAATTAEALVPDG